MIDMYHVCCTTQPCRNNERYQSRSTVEHTTAMSNGPIEPIKVVVEKVIRFCWAVIT